MQTKRIVLLTGVFWLVTTSGAATRSAAIEPVQQPVTGTVIETMDSSRYTYVKVDTGTVQLWAAGPTTPVAVGDTVSLANGFPVKDFRSNTLDRTFDTLYLVTAIDVEP